METAPSVGEELFSGPRSEKVCTANTLPASCMYIHVLALCVGHCRVASEVMEKLGAGTEVPDPGSWDTADVCFWMEGNTVNYNTELKMVVYLYHHFPQGIEKRSEFVKTFRDAEIDGLHLLELSPTEMTGIIQIFYSYSRCH